MKQQVSIFAGRSNRSFTAAICDYLDVEIGRMEVVKFSDGELSVEIEDNVRGRDVFVVQSTSAPGNDHLMELLIAIDALKRSSAWRITAVLPYFGYARQDRKLKPRVPITARLVADLLTAAGADRILTLDLHAGQIMGFFDIPVDNLNAMPVVLPYIRDNLAKNGDVMIVSPDAGGVERARLFAEKLNDVDIAIIDKRRAGPNQVAAMKVVGDVRNKTCIIVDDMIDTGGTLIKASDTLLEQGAKKVYACCIHPVLSGNAVERLEASRIEQLLVTDTIPISRFAKASKIKVLSVAPLMAEAIKRIHSDDSISSLFR